MITLLTIYLLSCFVNVVPAQAVNSSYVPTYVPCPDDLKIRPACGELSFREQEWRRKRLDQVAVSMGTYLNNAKIPQFDVSAYLDMINASTVPVVGMALSGGGSQAGMNGLGIWQALDDRYEPAVQAGTGGLVQCLSYLTGLSGGGAWAVAPLASNNFSSVEVLRQHSNLTNDYVNGDTGNTTEFFQNAFKNVVAKQREGFTTSVSDVFGQALAQFLAPSWRSKDYSDVASMPDHAFALGSGPMPILQLTEVIPGSSPSFGDILWPAPYTSTIYEQTPFEFGSWIGGRVQGFIPTKFLGTAMKDGYPLQSQKCINGFDKMMFAMASTSNAWNGWWLGDFYNITIFTKRDIPPILGKRTTPSNSSIPIPPGENSNFQIELVEETANILKQSVNKTLWAWYPNPFLDFSQQMHNVDELLIVDGSESGETLPLRPLMVPERELDFIIAFDSSSDNVANKWVNGTTFEQSSKVAKYLHIPFPDVPDATTFINLGMNQYPTFFGCPSSSSSSSSATPSPGPLVLYIPNAPWSSFTNYSYTVSQFTNHQLDLIFDNFLNAVSFGNGNITINPKSPPPSSQTGASTPRFSVCIACGLIYKSLLRMGAPLPAACQACFAAHCWNGTVVDSPNDPVYSPDLLLDPGLTYAEWNTSMWSAGT